MKSILKFSEKCFSNTLDWVSIIYRARASLLSVVIMRNEEIILSNRAQALANYPHARRVGDMIFVSGISSRKFDGTWEGVVERADGGYDLDIAIQTRAVIEKY